jgi:hypothetical protein
MWNLTVTSSTTVDRRSPHISKSKWVLGKLSSINLVSIFRSVFLSLICTLSVIINWRGISRGSWLGGVVSHLVCLCLPPFQCVWRILRVSVCPSVLWGSKTDDHQWQFLFGKEKTYQGFSHTLSHTQTNTHTLVFSYINRSSTDQT